MNKTERLAIEASSRQAINKLFKANASNQRVNFSDGGPSHEFDIFQEGVIVGGVSTSPLKVGKGSPNTGGKDRAASELLWLTLWPGEEKRLHVLTDRSLADWLYHTYKGADFHYLISVYHYDQFSQLLTEIGVLGITEKGCL
jgi:hypothetical protein